MLQGHEAGVTSAIAPADAEATSRRVRLEGRAERLEAARLRYRVLVAALKAFTWKRRVRASAAVVADAVRDQAGVDEALEAVRRRAALEAWPSDDEVLRCHADVERARAVLAVLLARRLGREVALAHVRDGLEALEGQVVAAPRLVLPHQRWTTALEVLPPGLPELERALRFGRRAERLFGRPQLAPASLPMSLDELDELIAGWPEGVAAVEALWARLVRIDLGGSLVRWLRKRARRALTAPPRTGPELLLFAEFWRQVAVARMDAFLEARVGLVAWREGERFPLLRWLWHRERALPSSLSLRSEPREALFEVAAVLSELPSSAERAPLVMAGLIPVARQADRLRETEAWARVRDELRVLARVVWASRGRRPPGAQDTLEGLVRALRDSG